MADPRQRFLETIRKYKGKPYVWGGKSPRTSFDCSGLLTWCAREAGLSPDLGDPNYTNAEGLKQHCVAVAWPAVQPGDILLFDRTYEAAPGYATHCGASLGAGTMRMLDTHDGPGVGETDISTAYWQAHLMSAWRPKAFVSIAPTPPPPAEPSCEQKLAEEISYSSGLMEIMGRCAGVLTAALKHQPVDVAAVADVANELTRNAPP